jgi:hypothetical protein
MIYYYLPVLLRFLLRPNCASLQRRLLEMMDVLMVVVVVARCCLLIPCSLVQRAFGPPWLLGGLDGGLVDVHLVFFVMHRRLRWPRESTACCSRKVEGNLLFGSHGWPADLSGCLYQ